MDKKDALKIKEKLNEVLSIANQFGKQSEQFATSRAGLIQLTQSIGNSNELLVQLLQKCDSYLDDTSHVMDGEYWARITEEIEHTKQIANDFKIDGEALNKQLTDKIAEYIACSQALEGNGNLLHEDIKLLIQHGNDINNLIETRLNHFPAEVQTALSAITTEIKDANGKLGCISTAVEQKAESASKALVDLETTITANNEKLLSELKDAMNAVVPETQKAIATVSQALLMNTTNLSDKINDSDIKIIPVIKAISNQLEQVLVAINTSNESTQALLNQKTETLLNNQSAIISNSQEIISGIKNANNQLEQVLITINTSNESTQTLLNQKTETLITNQHTIISNSQEIISEIKNVSNQITISEAILKKKLQKLELYAGISVGVIIILQIVNLLMK